MNLISFSYRDLPVRTIEENNAIWFVAKDVCEVLDIKNTTQAIQRLDQDERSMFNIGRQGETNVVNEYGLYSLILASRKPEAKQFKRWITHEVLPSIRKHGAYMTPDALQQAVANPDFMIGLLENLKLEQQKRYQAEALVEQQKPKVLFADAVETSETSILIGQLAKLITQNGISIGQNRLFSWLRKCGYLGKQGSHYNEPTQYSMERGWFEVTERTLNNPDGSVRITRTTKVTGKGQIYFINKFLKEGVTA